MLSMRTMSSYDRVIDALEFRKPDRLPRFESFWDYDDAWRETLGDYEAWNDVRIWYPVEATYPSRYHVIADPDSDGHKLYVDRWGRKIRVRKDAYFQEILEVPFPESMPFAELPPFEPPGLDSRYEISGTREATDKTLEHDKSSFCVFGKIGGLFIRTTQVRGFEQFLVDLASDRGLSRSLVERMYEHLSSVALQEIERWDLRDTGVWIYDDVAYNERPMISPKVFETVFFDLYRQLILRLKQAGARYVMLHSDGNIEQLLDMLVEAGFDGIHPVERRAGMNPFELRKRYPKLRFFGGMDNADLLRSGTRDEIERETRALIDLGRDGGLVIGSHSIGPDIPKESYLWFHQICERYGTYR